MLTVNVFLVKFELSQFQEATLMRTVVGRSITSMLPKRITTVEGILEEGKSQVHQTIEK